MAADCQCISVRPTRPLFPDDDYLTAAWLDHVMNRVTGYVLVVASIVLVIIQWLH